MQNRRLLNAVLSACSVLLMGGSALADVSSPVKSEQSILSFATNPSVDIAFGTWGPGLISEGPIGNKAVVRGQSFYLAFASGGRVVGAHDQSDRQWANWYYNLNRALLHSWLGDIPGQAQLILRVTPDGRVTAVKEIAFVPGLDKAGHFEMGSETHDAFLKRVNECLAAVKIPTIPSDSGASFKTATFVATFSADKNMEASIPDLNVLAAVPNDEKSQWIARICTILDAGFLYDESDALRLRLPEASRHRFIPSGIHHTLHSTNYGPGTGGITWLPATKGCADHQTSQALVATLASYIDSGRYTEAEAYAQTVLRDAASIKIQKQNLDRIQAAVEDAMKKGYFEMDRKNTPHPPSGAVPDFI